MVYALTVVAALIVALGEVIQQRWAAQAPPEYNLTLRLLLWLVQQPRWLAGVACSLAGNLVFVAALSMGGVIVIEAVFVIRLIFALLIAAFWWRHPIPLKEAIGAAAITAGLVAFLLAGRPDQGDATNVPVLHWAIGGGSVVTLAALFALIGSRLRPARKATFLGAAAGTLYGVQASLMQSAILIITGTGFVALLATWNGYAVIAVALLGMLFVQSAFEAASIEASYPAVVTAQLLSAIAIGVWVLGGTLHLAPLSLGILVPALLLMIVGIYLVSTSPIVTGQAGLLREATRSRT